MDIPLSDTRPHEFARPDHRFWPPRWARRTCTFRFGGCGAKAFDRSGEGSVLAAMRTLLCNPPPAVEDDVPSQAWLVGLIAVADNVLRCHDTAPVAVL